ncbi:MAG: EI24 domain-containing protein, partial [Micrococcales bacterium]|nr:EI24 domain-containing protein [Micrococcales bacterium]
MLRELRAGAGAFIRGLRTWARTPRLMLVGAIPALLVGLVVMAGFVLVATRLPGIVDVLTPFAEDWGDPARTLARVGAGAAVLVALVLVAVSTFTALTLAVGDPFYERIWLSVERDLGGFTPAEAGFWSSLRGAVATGLHLLGKSLLLGALLFLVGL